MINSLVQKLGSSTTPGIPTGGGGGLKANTEEKKKFSPTSRIALVKFTVYETKMRYYIVGENYLGDKFRVLKIDRTTSQDLTVVEDEAVYAKEELSDLLDMIALVNRNTGGLNRKMEAYGVVGFIKFLEGFYLILITQRHKVALLGGNYVYHIDDFSIISIDPNSKTNRPDETRLVTPLPRTNSTSKLDRYMAYFQQVDLCKNFFFSYTYDITKSLQNNFTIPQHEAVRNTMFIWNYYLLSNGFTEDKISGKVPSDWVLPVVHGFLSQTKIDVYGRSIYVTLIARRSRLYAGTRFQKRGMNDQGYVANDVETEQIVHDSCITSFHHPGHARYGNPFYTSYVHHRGSIPLFWSQDTSNMAMKPPIELKFRDPFFSSAAKHFDNMMHRYGSPIIILNLVKAREKTKRESILLEEFTEAVSFLNQALPPERKLIYIAWDMSWAFKSPNEDVIESLEKIAEEALASTGFFHSGPESAIHLLRDLKRGVKRSPTLRKGPKLQCGVVRTNCIDCIDRTNAAQFMIGKCALGYQLYALNVIEQPTVPFDCDAVNILTEMYHDHGDTIALQYGGSHLVNTLQTYRKINQWSSSSRDMIEAIRRYYSNSFVDEEKQRAINLFLGNYIPSNDPRKIQLWDLQNDAHLHNSPPWNIPPPRNYNKWWTENEAKTLVTLPIGQNELLSSDFEYDCDDPLHSYWYNVHASNAYTDMDEAFQAKITSTYKSKNDQDTSPFEVKDGYLPQASTAINGYKGWLTLSKSARKEPKRVVPKTVVEDQSNGKGRNQEQQPIKGSEKLDKGTTKAFNKILKKLNSPEINPAEFKEYTRYVNQYRFNPLLEIPDPSKAKDSPVSTTVTGTNEMVLPLLEDLSSVIKHPEYKQYLSYVTKSKMPSIATKVTASDELIYNSAVRLNQGISLCASGGDASMNASMGAVGDEEEEAMIDAYDVWLTGGKFKTRKKRQAAL